ncbi:MAG: DUF2789 domain-containing protein [Sterolibacterium sp.]|nr:DUF2789 domain-containing protein [Sterolibacterium sp.]
MERSPHDMNSLFAQLGEASDAQSIARFISSHAPLDGDVQLHEASFWTAAQAGFLREATLDDAEWVVIIDALNSELHARY